MPGFRALPLLRDEREVLTGASLAGLGISPTFLDLLRAPAWIAALNTLVEPYIRGWSIDVDSQSLEELLRRIRQFLRMAPASDGEGSWLAFIRTPLRFAAGDGMQYKIPFWSGELTDWGSYSRISGHIVEDHAYAFRLPVGFIQCIARRARSWDGAWSVSTEHDVSAEIYVLAPASMFEQSRVRALRRHAEGQFLAWTCRESDLFELERLLDTAQLVFRRVEGALQEESGMVVGVIAEPFFEPAVGMMHLAGNWAEFEAGTVRFTLQKAGLIEVLPGKPGSEVVSRTIMSLLRPDFMTAPTHQWLSGDQVASGLPIDHSNRMIWLHRFQVQPIGGFHKVQANIDAANAALPSMLAAQQSATLTCHRIHGVTHEITRVSYSWKPSLLKSSAEAISEMLTAVVDLFDRSLPRIASCGADARDTLDVLRYDGELYFEGDDSWGFGARKSR